MWLVIFVTYVGYRRGRASTARSRSAGQRDAVLAAAGATVVAAIAVSTWAIDSFDLTLRIGLPFMLLLWLAYTLLARRLQANASRLCADPLAG
ncbi:hypothetical protein D3C87_2005410 [compost metagenome]